MLIYLDIENLIIFVKFMDSDKQVGNNVEAICATIDVVNYLKPRRSIWIDDVLTIQVRTATHFVTMFDGLEMIRVATKKKRAA